MTRLVIVRHGNTFEAGEAPRRIGARTDLPLTGTGVEQARALGRHFAANGVRFDRVLAGELQRTRATAAEIVGEQAPAVETVAFLTEIDHGPDEGQPEAEVVARLGSEAIALWETERVAPDGWEVGAQWRVSAWREFVERTAEELPEGTILLVTSNGAARFALAALGLKPGAGMKFRTGSYGVVEVGGGADFRLLAWDVRPGETSGELGWV
ncbi:MAG: phosphoglycerate mutase [Devosia sp.]|uniref:histidine phosphatase family protein n=1 Tax=Devosia sp. TaxID=1871048 RepID=UPI0026084CAC|nr:histidine phosphatase family protein [Devosia sp.]MDB5542443.1 phosphoglycerate mutase [Devosia sp.]